MSLGLLAVFGLMTGEARAGSLTEVLTWNWAGHGTQTLVISGGPYATSNQTSSGTSLTFIIGTGANIGPLNTYLKNHGSALQFGAGSGAYSNQNIITPGETAVLTSNGNLSVIQGSTGSTQMKIDVYQTDWTTPYGINGNLQNSGSATFTSTASGDTEKFNSWFDSTDSGTPPTGMAAGMQTYTATYGPGQNVSSPIGSPVNFTSMDVGTVTPPYALSNETTVTLTQENIRGENGQYQVTTTLAATIPEPASLVLLLTSIPLPLTVVGGLRRRRARCQVD